MKAGGGACRVRTRRRLPEPAIQIRENTSMNSRSEIARAVRRALLMSAVAAAGVSAPAFAQDQETTEQNVETVTVTGSRIPAPNLESTSPIQVITTQDI